MYFTNQIDEDNKLGSYTNDPNTAAQMGYNITVKDIEIADNGFAYIKGFAPAPLPKNYIEMRTNEYPTIAEQLDTLYWDKINGTNNWLNTISNIKQKYPKQ